MLAYHEDQEALEVRQCREDKALLCVCRALRGENEAGHSGLDLDEDRL